MGALFLFECSQCGYSAEVSGGRDWGMRSITRTITCSVCKDLFDVEVGTTEEPGDCGVARRSERKHHLCPNDASHRVRVWKPGLGCPRCSTKMTAGPITVLWD